MTERAFSKAELEQLARLAALPDDQIDTSDIPEIPEEKWKHARRPSLHGSTKRPGTTMRSTAKDQQ